MNNQQSVSGFILQNDGGNALAKKLYWSPYRDPKVAWVHPANTLADVLRQARNWAEKPVCIHAAVWSGDIVSEIINTAKLLEPLNDNYITVLETWLQAQIATTA